MNESRSSYQSGQPGHFRKLRPVPARCFAWPHATLFIIVACGCAVRVGQAQHVDIAVFRNASGRITTHDVSRPELPPRRTFERAFDFFGHLFGNPAFPKVFSGDDPGFDFSGNAVPAAYTALPSDTDLSLNLLPFQVPGQAVGNLFHWDGLGTEVLFGSPPSQHTLTVVEAGGARSFELNGSDGRWQDVVVGVTDNSGGMHEHLQFRLDDNDHDAATDPAGGFYLFAWELTMPGLQTSEPVFVALSSPEMPATLQQQVVEWMELHVDFFIPGGQPGDFDTNGLYECQDIDLLVSAIAAGNQDPIFDLTGDGQINLADRDAWLAIAGAANLSSGNPFLLGDANLDGAVDVSDFNLWNSHRFTGAGGWCQGDFSADGSVDVSDFNLWNGRKFRHADDSLFQAVPEPATGTGLWLWACLACRRRRSRRGAAS